MVLTRGYTDYTDYTDYDYIDFIIEYNSTLLLKNIKKDKDKDKNKVKIKKLFKNFYYFKKKN